MQPKKLSHLDTKERYLLDKFCAKNNIEGLRVEGVRQYAMYGGIDHYDVTGDIHMDAYKYMPEIKVETGDCVGLRMPLDVLLNLLLLQTEADKAVQAGHGLNGQYGAMAERAFKAEEQLDFDKHLRKKHIPLQKVYEKYMFVKSMVTDMQKGTK